MGFKNLFSKQKKEDRTSPEYLARRKAELDEKANRDFFSLTEQEEKEYYEFHPELGYVPPVQRTEFNPWELDANYIPPGYEKEAETKPDNEASAFSAIEDAHSSADEIRKLLERSDLSAEAVAALKKASDILEHTEQSSKSTETNSKINDKRLQDILKEVPDNCKTLTWFDRLDYKNDINTVLDNYCLKMSSIYKCNGKYYFNIFASSEGRSDILMDDECGFIYKYTIGMNECKSLCLDVMWYLRVFTKTLGHLKHHVNSEKARERLEKEGPFSFRPEDTGDYDLAQFCKKGKLDLLCTVIKHGDSYPTNWNTGVMEEAEKHLTEYFQTQADRIVMTGAKDEYYE